MGEHAEHLRPESRRPRAAAPRVLIVEDDRSVREAAAMVLSRAGFDVSTCADGATALDDETAATEHALVLLDLMLPGATGFEVCRWIRARSSVPIIVLTARSDAIDVVTGLELGADDYITKPFDAAVLVARVRAVLRRYGSNDAADTPVMRARDITIDVGAASAHRGDSKLTLTVTEFRLLAELVRKAGSVLTREELLERVWGYDYLGDSRLVDMAVMRLREKLGPAPVGAAYISTVRGVGYRCET